jgi:phage tail-like protein
MADPGSGNGSNGSGADDEQYFTLAGQRRRLFSTRSLKLPELGDGNGAEPGTHREDPPPVAVTRRVLRSELPAVYQENDFGLRFVGGLEGVLDPVLALLDSLPAHIDPDLAPQDLLDLLAGWLGVEVDEAWPEKRRRELVRLAGELARLRGTQAGLELALRVSFPDVPLRIEDSGSVSYAADPAGLPKAKKPQFDVYCDQPLEEKELARVAATIEQLKPVHVDYRLRVKTPQTRQK